MIGLGRPGGRETTRVSGATEVETPWQIFVRCCVVDGLKAMAATAALFVVIAAVWTWITSSTGFWRATWAGIRGAWTVIRWILVLPVLAWLWRVWHHGTLVVHQRWEPEQIDPYAHQPYGAREPETRGRSFWDDYYDWHDQEVPPEPLPTSLVPPVMVENDRGEWDDAGRPPLPEVNGDWKLRTLLRATMSGVRPFSRAGAMRDGLYTRNEWEALEEWTIGAGLHQKGTGALGARGKRWAVGTINRLVPDRPPTPAEGQEAP
jgi:hypothetical protein